MAVDEYKLYNLIIRYLDERYPDASPEEREEHRRRCCNAFLNI